MTTHDSQILSLSTRVAAAHDQGVDPRSVLRDLLHLDDADFERFEGIEPESLWNILFRFACQEDLRRPFTRRYVKELDNVFDMIIRSNKIVVLMGAGASSGPDFRSPGGLYDSISKCNVLDDPYDVFDTKVYAEKPEIFWNFANLIFPSKEPVYSQAHLFIEKLEANRKLLRVYTQNVDTLEKGIPENKLRCVHGSWRKNKCISCGRIYGIEDLRDSVEKKIVPRCVECGAVIQPGIVFFGQSVNFDRNEAYRDACEADLLIVIGTSLKVAPISHLPHMLRNVPSILINREPVGMDFNAELIGECDDIIQMIENNIRWREYNEIKQPLFYPPNKFIFKSNSQCGTSVAETGRNMFLVTPRRLNYVFDD